MNRLRYLLPVVLAAGFAAPAVAQSGARAPALLIHGNYCGPGNNAPLPPTDALDAACARHDACTRTGHLPSGACNARLKAEAEAVAGDPRQDEHVRTMADIVGLGASLMPSEGYDGRRRVAAVPEARPLDVPVRGDLRRADRVDGRLARVRTRDFNPNVTPSNPMGVVGWDGPPGAFSEGVLEDAGPMAPGAIGNEDLW